MRDTTLRFASIAAVALWLAGCGNDDGGPHANATFAALGTLPGYATSAAAAVSSDGAVVAGTATTTAGFRQAFRRTANGGVAGLGFLAGGTYSVAKGIAADGSVVVGDADGAPAAGTHVFRWSAAAGSVAVPGLPGATLCAAGGVSGDASAIVGTCLAFNNEAFRWNEATGARGLGRFGTGSNATSSGLAIASNGRAVGGAGHPVLTGAVLWDANGAATILGGLAGETEGTISALSRDGSVAVGTSLDALRRSHAFRWSAAGGLVPLPVPDGAVATFAAGVSGDGRRIVGWATVAGEDIAMLWDEDGRVRPVSERLSAEARALAEGWKLVHARAISDDGRVIVGDGVNGTGVTEGWIVTLGP